MPAPLVQVLPEKEARAIASQICAGLAYLNQPPNRIIHYDLKPANVLFDKFGEVKITVPPPSPPQALPPRHPAAARTAACRYGDSCIASFHSHRPERACAKPR